MDWTVFWCASGVIVTLFGILASLILSGFKSLRGDIRSIDQRLSKLEGAFEERGRWESKRN